MDINLVFEQIQSLNGMIYAINKREPEAIRLLDKLNRQLFGESVVINCSNCHIKAFKKLTSLTIQDLQAMSEKRFKLKKGILVEFPFRSGNFYVAETMTDEISERYLRTHPQMVKQFASYPADFTFTEPSKAISKEPIIVEAKTPVIVENKVVAETKKNKRKRK